MTRLQRRFSHVFRHDFRERTIRQHVYREVDFEVANTGPDMTIRIYLRCSSEDQNVKSQRYELEMWARGQDGPIEWYSDEGYSGLNLDRPAWRKLVGDLQADDRLVCFAIDRIARDLLHFLSVIRQLKAQRVVFHSLREAVDISTPFGEAMCEILAVFGKLETRIRQGRQRAGIEARRDPVTRKCPWGGRKPGVG